MNEHGRALLNEAVVSISSSLWPSPDRHSYEVRVSRWTLVARPRARGIRGAALIVLALAIHETRHRALTGGSIAG
jgi:hypothetical protein